jgi:uncharacterized membrane protein YeaQ/YmgE (transglycosylase-associated protein family)
MNVILWIVFGAIVGWIASLVMNTNHEQGTLMDVILGIIGAVIGGWLMGVLGEPGVTGFNLYSVFVAVIGAVVLLSLKRMFYRNA